MLMTMVMALAMAGTDPDLAALVPRIEHAVVVGSVPALEQCRDSLLAGVKDAARPDINMLRYTLAYVDWRLFPLLDAAPGTKPQGSARLEEAGRQLLDVIKGDPQNAEALALLSTVYGQMIGTSAWKGITLGPKSSAAIEQALKLAGANPRVALLSGVGAFFAPSMFGGGPDKAEQELKRADSLFSAESPNKSWPNWGRLDVLAWLGQVLASRGNRDGARALYMQALAAQPDYAWVKYALMPALDSRSRKK